jgi:hypothetical protein
MTTCGKNWDATVYYKANYKWHHNVKRSERNRIGAVSDSGKPTQNYACKGIVICTGRALYAIPVMVTTRGCRRLSRRHLTDMRALRIFSLFLPAAID